MTDPKDVEILAAVVTGRGTSSHEGRNVQRTCKIWPHVSVQLEALVSNTDRSRNDLINRLLEAGLEALKENLTEDEVDRLFTMDQDTLQRGIKEDE